jgi:hypothetical protein
MPYKIRPRRHVKLNLPIPSLRNATVPDFKNYLISMQCNSNWRIAVQTGRCFRCTVQSFIDVYSCLFLEQLFRLLQPKSHYCIHKNEHDNAVFTHGPYKFMHLASCSYCATGPSGQFFVLHNMLPLWGSENERLAQNVTWYIKHCAVPST